MSFFAPGPPAAAANPGNPTPGQFFSQQNLPATPFDQTLYSEMQRLPGTPYNGLKLDDLWKLMFMERDRIKYGENDYEREEQGYLQGVMNGYLFMLSTIGRPLTPDLYEQLHDHCVEGIYTAEHPRGIPKGYRRYSDGAEAFYLIPGHTVSDKGVKELKNRINTYAYVDDSTKDRFNFLKDAIQSPETTVESQKPILKLKPTRPETCKRNAQFCIDLYLAAPKNSEQEKLFAIAGICQDLDQLHLFVDGNIRTTGILLVNKLLIENGISPTVMRDVNQLDCLSREEIVDLIREGQNFFENLKKCNQFDNQVVHSSHF